MTFNLEKSCKALWRLFMTTHSILVDAIERELAQAGLPPLAWYDVLSTLSESPEHKLRMHELASTMILDRSNLTRLVDRMEVAGLVCRKSCSSDRRGSFAALTETGQVMQRKMQVVYEQAVARYFACHLNDAEIKVLTKALEQMQVKAHETALK